MKITKKLKVFLIVLAMLSSPFFFYKLQGTKIHWLKFENKKITEDNLDVFVIQNPPSSKEDLIKLIEKINDTIDLKSRANTTYYVQSFYKETFNLTRFYKPYYKAFIGTYIDIRADNAEFIKEHLADYVYKDEESNRNCGDWCRIYPYYIFYNRDGTINCEFYPKGLKGNPNKHWDIR